MSDQKDWLLYQIEQMLRRITRSRVSTQRYPDSVVFTIDYRWQFIVEWDEIDRLADYLDNQGAFKDEYEKMLPTHLRLKLTGR